MPFESALGSFVSGGGAKSRRLVDRGPSLGASLYELGPGNSIVYHFHHGSEELLIVLRGRPTLRGPEGERRLDEGAVVHFPVGPDGAHQITGPGTVVIVSTRRTPEIVEYPDSGKVGLSPPGKLFRTEDAVDYWDGE